MKIKVEISARHIHLSINDLEKLFGKGYKLKKLKELSQTGEFAAKESVKLINGKKSFNKVRIVGPVRKNTQTELSLTDSRFLGIDAPIRLSGDIKNTPGVTVIGPKGKILLKKGVIVPQRHLHISNVLAKKLKLKKGQAVKIKITGQRELIFDKVIVRTAENFITSVHLDTDEANAAGLKSCSYGKIIIK